MLDILGQSNSGLNKTENMKLERLRVSSTPSKGSVLCFLVIIVVLATGFFASEAQAIDQRANQHHRHLQHHQQRTTRAALKYSVSGEDIEDDDGEEYESTLPPPPPSSPHLRRAHDRLLERLHTFNATIANSQPLTRPKKNTLEDDHATTTTSSNEDFDENNFCSHDYVDSAYYNGYDYILTRGDRLWYYYRSEHRLSRAYDQRKFTQGDHIQGALNVSSTPTCTSTLRPTTRRPAQPTPPSRSDKSFGTRLVFSDDCGEINKMRGMAVYFLHNKKRARSYYNLDLRYPNGTQRRVKSRDLPWGMKQVGLLGGNLWPNQWEAYQLYRPVAFLPSRYEMIFIFNHFRLGGMANGSKAVDHLASPLLTWNKLDAQRWNSSWRSRVLAQADVTFTGLFEMDGVVYAIGEKQPAAGKERMAWMYEYQITEGDGRRLKELGQSIGDFFGCPKKTTEVSTTTTTTTTTTHQSPTRPSAVASTIKHSKPTMISKVLETTTSTTTTTTTTTTKKPLIIITTENSIIKNVTFDEPVGKKVEDDDDDDNDNDSEEEEDDNNITKDQVHTNPAVSTSRKPNVFLSSSDSNQIYSSVFAKNSKANVQPISGNNKREEERPILASHPGASLREADSILLTIFIGIVVSACIATIILAFLTISGRKKTVAPRFEGARIERTIPKPTIIGLDYQQRKNSSTSSMNMMMRYDSMNSINAIYSRIGKPLRGIPEYHRQPGSSHQLHHHHHHHQHGPMGSEGSNTRILVESSPDSGASSRSYRQQQTRRHHHQSGDRPTMDNPTTFLHRQRASPLHQHHHHNHHYRGEEIGSPPPPPPPPPLMSPNSFQPLD